MRMYTEESGNNNKRSFIKTNTSLQGENPCLNGSTYQGSCLYPVLASPRCGRCGESALVSTKEPHAARFSLDKPLWAYLTYTDKNPRLVIYSLTVVSTYAHIDREKLGSSPGIGPGGKTFVHANQPNLTRRKVTRRTI